MTWLMCRLIKFSNDASQQITTLLYIKRACELNKSHIISTDEDPGLRIESFAVINLRGVSTNKTIIGIKTVYDIHSIGRQWPPSWLQFTHRPNDCLELTDTTILMCNRPGLLRKLLFCYEYTKILLFAVYVLFKTFRGIF